MIWTLNENETEEEILFNGKSGPIVFTFNNDLEEVTLYSVNDLGNNCVEMRYKITKDDFETHGIYTAIVECLYYYCGMDIKKFHITETTLQITCTSVYSLTTEDIETLNKRFGELFSDIRFKVNFHKGEIYFYFFYNLSK